MNGTGFGGFVLHLSLCLIAIADDSLVPFSIGHSISVIDVSSQSARQVIIDQEKGQYLGHPTMVLLEDNKTMIAVYPKGRGKGAIVMKRSVDGGLPGRRQSN